MTARGVTHDIPPEHSLALRYWRKRTGMTQQQVADLIYIGQNSINTWEHHKGRIPAWRLQQLADLFTGGDVEAFLEPGRAAMAEMV